MIGNNFSRSDAKNKNDRKLFFPRSCAANGS
jgi:hypothetical protein